MSSVGKRPVFWLGIASQLAGAFRLMFAQERSRRYPMVATPACNPSKREAFMRLRQTLLAIALVLGLMPLSAQAQGADDTFSLSELIESSSRFFGTVSRGLALTVQEAVKRWGEPNGYILGEEASGALIGGVRYGEGVLHTRNAGRRRVFWQGPSVGFDVGGDGGRTMMLVYNLPAVESLYTRFVGLNGSAYLVGGDRKSTRLNSSHTVISYAVFCLKKKKTL